VPASIPAFRAESFEYLEAGAGLALLRLSGFWSEADPPAGSTYLTVTGAGGEPVELAPLPAPQGSTGVWRAAFSAPTRLLADPMAAFALEPERGDPIVLPAPTRHGGAESAPSAGSAERQPADTPASEGAGGGFFARRRGHDHLKRALAAERDARREAERAAAGERARAERAEASLREELREAVDRAAELLARIDDYEHRRVTFPEELDAVRRTHADLLAATREEHRLELEAVREETEAMRRELDAAHREVATANEQLDVTHEAQAVELASARRQRDDALERQEDLERRLAAARAEVEALAARLADREDLLDRARAEAAVALGETQELQDATARLRDAIVARAEAAAHSGGRMRSAAELQVTQDELQEGIDRLAALERQAEALRDAIYAKLPAGPSVSPSQEALPLSVEGDEPADQQAPVRY
jgi:hypothetical protein